MQFEQPHADRFRVRRQVLPRHRQNILDADGDQDTIDRLSRPALLQQIEEGEPAFLVALGVGILRRIAPRRIDQNGLFREPPIAVARAADACDRGRRRAPRQRKFQTGIDQRRRLARARRTDDDVPGQIIEIAGLVAAGGLQRGERVLHALLEHGLVVDRLFGAADAFGDLLGALATLEDTEAGNRRGARDEKQDDNVANDGIFKRMPVAEGDERAGEVDDGRQRAEPDAVQDDLDNLLWKHAAFIRSRLFAAFDEDFDSPVLGAPFRRRVAGDRRVRSLAFDVDRGRDR